MRRSSSVVVFVVVVVCRLSSVVASVVARAPARPSRARPAPAPCLHALVPPFPNLSPKPLPKTTADARQGYLSRRLVIVVAAAPSLSRRRRGAGSALRSGRYAVGAVAYGLQLVGLNVRAALLPLHVFLGLFCFCYFGGYSVVGNAPDPYVPRHC